MLEVKISGFQLLFHRPRYLLEENQLHACSIYLKLVVWSSAICPGALASAPGLMGKKFHRPGGLFSGADATFLCHSAPPAEAPRIFRVKNILSDT